MLKLKSIQLRNWCKAAESRIDFPDKGFVFLRGINHVTSEDSSNGSGKTALGEAINRTLLGQSLCSSLVSYSRNRAGNTYVDISAEFRGQPLRVEMGYRCTEFSDCKGEGLRFTYAGQEPVERPLSSQTRSELTALLGVTPEVSLWTVFLDGDRLKFNRLAQSEALSLLMQALNQPPWEVFKERAERRRDVARDRHNTAQTKLAQLQSISTETEHLVGVAVENLKTVSGAWSAAVSKWEQDKLEHEQEVQKIAETITKASKERDELRREIKAVQNADAEKCGALELTLSQLGSERRQTERYLTGWAENVSSDRTSLRLAEQELLRLQEKKNCPTCRRPLTESVTADHLTEIQRRIEGLEKALEDSLKGKTKCDNCLTEIDEEISQKHQERESLRSSKLAPLSFELETVEARLASADRQLRAKERASPAPPNDTAVQSARTLLDERQRAAKTHASALGAAAEAVAQSERALSLAQYWVKGFSPEGIPNLVLRQTIGPLNDAARLVSASLSGNLVQVAFSAEAELASGTMKPKLVTEVQTKHGAAEFLRNSKGEASFANLIIAETQTHVGRILSRVGYRWFDEVANSLSGSARRTLYSGLRRQANDLGLLTFVVDHHDEASNCADHVLIAEKSTDGVTSYRWE